MPRNFQEDNKYWEDRVKRAWESIRRSEEFRNDCTSLQQLPASTAEIGRRQISFTDKWGVTFYDSRRSYLEVRNVSESHQRLEAKRHGEALAADTAPDIPECFVFLLGRLQGYSGPADRTIECREEEEMHALLKAKTNGQYHDMNVKEWRNHLGSWAPRRKVRIIVDLDADPFVVASRLLDILPVLHEIRVLRGLSAPYPDQVNRKLNSNTSLAPGGPYDTEERFNFANDDKIFQVWDLKQSGKSMRNIACEVWPDQIHEGEGPYAEAGDRGTLGQRIRDYNKKAMEWIQEHTAMVKLGGSSGKN